MQTKNGAFLFDSKGNFPYPWGMKYRLILLPLLVAAAPAYATKTVTSPYVNEGTVNIESKTGYVIDDDSNIDGRWQEVLGLGYGITEYWGTEIELGFGQSGARNADTETESIEWQHKFQFAPKGEWPVDVGARVAYGYSTNGGADEIEAKVMAGKAIEQWSLLANAAIAREVGDDSSDDTSYGLSWSASYDVDEAFQPGIEMYNDFGGGGDPEHMIGPVAYGKVLGGIGYNTGVLFGLSDDVPDATVKFVVDYKFKP